MYARCLPLNMPDTLGEVEPACCWPIRGMDWTGILVFPSSLRWEDDLQGTTVKRSRHPGVSMILNAGKACAAMSLFIAATAEEVYVAYWLTLTACRWGVLLPVSSPR